MPIKTYCRNQTDLFPINLDDMIKANDPVRLLDCLIEGIDMKRIFARYNKKGASAYDPKMMIKVIFYAYTLNIYSSRKIEEALRSNIKFMWLSGMQTPDHNTINIFRTSKLQKPLKNIFSQIVIQLEKEGLLNLEKAYTDGTKIEANANKYSFVWGKAIQTRFVKMAATLNEIWDYADQTCKREMEDKTPILHTDITSEKIEEILSNIDQSMSSEDMDIKIKQKFKRIKKEYPQQIKKYEEQRAIIGEDRNSYSKTDPDATFMRMKEDHMGNGQLKPAYNTQISTESEFITNYTIHQSPTDTNTLIEHLEEYKEQYGHYPKDSICDAGYGSEENYLFTQENNITPFIKYNYFHKEQTKKWQEDHFNSSNFPYDKERDCCICPMEQEMYYVGEKVTKTKTGFIQKASLYQAQDCKNCQVRSQCHKSSKNRVIQINHRLKKLKDKARELLLSEEGIKHRRKRPVEVEQTFGNLKQNKNFRRFSLRGLKKVETEFGLLAIAHNISKYCNKITPKMAI